MKNRRMRKKGARRAPVLSVYLLAVAAALLGWLYQSIPDIVYVEQGREVRFARFPYLCAQGDVGEVHTASTSEVGSYNTTLSLGGVLPIKSVRTVVTARPVVTVCGTPFGIKMFSEGALIVAFSDLDTPEGAANPAKEAGLKLGDRIISMDGTPTHDNDDLHEILAASGGRTLATVYVRAGEQRSTALTPVLDSTGEWKAGIWVRDSSAGVGTLTFLEEGAGVFAGLGHSISDSDTGESITLRSGEIVACEITGCTPGQAGVPGELKGQFIGMGDLGRIVLNGVTGVYGTTRAAFKGTQMEVAFAQEVTTGRAQLLTTIHGTEAESYDVEIEHITLSGKDANRNLVVRVTDPTLLDATGGIVQGMSGSPILQQGRLVGAVTHVLVNDPTRGYGIFAQTMLEQAQQVADSAA